MASPSPCDCRRTRITVKGDWRGVPVLIGLPYVFRYRFSTAYLRAGSEFGGVDAVNMGRLALRRWAVNHTNTAHYVLETRPHMRDVSRKSFTARVVGHGDNKVNRLPLADGTMTAVVLSKAIDTGIDLVNASFLPSWFTSAEWEGHYHNRAKRI